MNYFFVFILLGFCTITKNHFFNAGYNRHVGTGDTIKTWAEIHFDSLGMINKMAYADTANFMHEKIYPLRPLPAAA